MKSRKKNLLIISGSGAQGGAEKQLLNLINNLEEFNIYLLIYNANKKFFNSINRRNIKKIFFVNKKYFYLTIKSFKKLNNILKVLGENIIIHGWLPKGNLIAFLFFILINKKKKSLIFSHRNSFFLYQTLSSQIVLFSSLIISILNLGKIYHVANSHSIFDSNLIRFMLGRKRYLIKNGFNIDNLTFDKSINKENLILLYVARYSPEKGHENLFKVLSKVKFKFKLILVGSGCNKENKEIIYKLNLLNCEYEMHDSTEDLTCFYKKSSFTLLFSRSEASPNVLVESMLSGTPCISTPVGNVNSIISSFGWISNDFEVSSILTCLEGANKVFFEEDKYKKLCFDAFNHAYQNFDLKNMIYSYSKLYELIGD